MTKKEIAYNYLSYLEKGKVDKIISLFTEDGIVESPLYGVQPTSTFYQTLVADTNTSELKIDGLFFEEETNRITLVFDYRWELKDGNTVDFKVVDLIELNLEHKIKKLTIIYDTIHSREALNLLKEKV